MAVKKSAGSRLRKAGGKARKSAKKLVTKVKKAVRKVTGRKPAKKPAKKSRASRPQNKTLRVPPVVTQPPVLDEALAEPLFDASGVYQLSSKLVSAQRDRDEDDERLFRDPSVVIETQAARRRRLATEAPDDSSPEISGLFDVTDSAVRKPRP